MEADRLGRLRDIVAHDYANVDLKIVWEVATVHVPEVCAVLEKFFSTQTGTSDAPAECPASCYGVICQARKKFFYMKSFLVVG